MKKSVQRSLSILSILVFAGFTLGLLMSGHERTVIAQDSKDKPTPIPEATPAFDQAAAIANLKEKIKGKEQLPAGEVFENVKDFAKMPAGRLLAVMEFGYARSLGVNCTHCHIPENWASEEKRAKRIARQMRAMGNTINGELLGSIKEFEGRTGRDRPVVNCTTCHRGQVKPATNLGK